LLSAQVALAVVVLNVTVP